jgi:hypothetical protein
MPKLEVIDVQWVKDDEVHIYSPGAAHTWWARPLRNLRGGEVWELHDDLDEIEGFYETPEDAFQAVSERYDDAPIVVTKEREQ